LKVGLEYLKTDDWKSISNSMAKRVGTGVSPCGELLRKTSMRCLCERPVAQTVFPRYRDRRGLFFKVN